MLTSYAFTISQQGVEEAAKQGMQLFDTRRCERIGRFRRRDDQLRSLYGEWLARRSIANLQGCRMGELQLEYNEFGRPSFRDCSYSYNISHSGDWVVCAVSDGQVGIDLEEIKTCRCSVAERFYSREEYEYLMALPKEQQKDYFYQLWTLKEGYIKYIGKGMAIALDSFAFVQEKNGLRLKTDCKPAFFDSVVFHETYRCSVVAEQPVEPLSMKEVELSWLQQP